VVHFFHFCVLSSYNEPPRSKLRGIKAEFAEANPPSLFKLPTSLKLRRDKSPPFAPPSSVGTELLAKADHPCSKLQGILAKANKGHK